ncbi:THO complex subunit 1 transcription elongation factor-domain-containing protein [Schizophyllum commune]
MIGRRHLQELVLNELPPPPVDAEKVTEVVKRAIDATSGEGTLDNRRGRWEILLRQDIFRLAATEAEALKDPETDYYDHLQLRLDLVLTFAELDLCDPGAPLAVVADVLETQTVQSCAVFFTWLQSRYKRIVPLVPNQGKGTNKNSLALLRMLNALLKRLSKTGATEFCGRIMTFLSDIFPLSERSGVNLRGEYGPMWKGVGRQAKEEEKKDEGGDVKMEDSEEKPQVTETKEADAMQVDEDASKANKISAEKMDLYQTFWSLQLPFSRPPLFGTDPALMNRFKEGVNKILPVIKEATAKERAMMGSRSGASSGAKRKREPDTTADANSAEYFFAKYLTSPELLDLEIADTQFRRQFLFQLLVLLNHLLTFTPNAKVLYAGNNRSVQMEFTLEGENERWVVDTARKAMEELKQTTPNGRLFADTVSVILERERNWVAWKAATCLPKFDKEPWSEEMGERRVWSLEQATEGAREKMREPPKPWPYPLGTAPLSAVWETGYRDISSLALRASDEDRDETSPEDELRGWVRKAQAEQKRIDLRMAQLERSRPKPKPASPPPPPAPAAEGEEVKQEAADAPKPEAAPVENKAPPPPPPPINDLFINKAEQAKERWNWLGLRAVRTSLYCSFAGAQAAPCKNEVEEWERHIITQRQKEKEKAEAAGKEEEVGTASPMPRAAALTSGLGSPPAAAAAPDSVSPAPDTGSAPTSATEPGLEAAKMEVDA